MSDSHLYGEDLIFADQLLERLYEFTKREATHPEDAMVLECVDGRHRYIVHQAVQLFPSLASFSVGDGKMRRPVVCFAAKLPRGVVSQSSSNNSSASVSTRRLYQPPTRRNIGGHENMHNNVKPSDEKLQDQLLSRMRYIYSSSEDESIEDRVPNLNPHAASFIPFSIQTSSSPSTKTRKPTVHQDYIPTSYGYNENLYPNSTALNPTVPEFRPTAATTTTTHHNHHPQQQQQDDNKLSSFLNTYTEFVPRAASAPSETKEQLADPALKTKKKTEKESPAKAPKKTKPASAYVPPPLRNKQQEPKRQLTEDEVDRIKNQERKMRAMAEREERIIEEQNHIQQSHSISSGGGGGGRSGYAAFKKEKKKKYTEQKTVRSAEPIKTENHHHQTLRRESGSSGSGTETTTPHPSGSGDNQNNGENEIPMPLCWADDEPLDQTVIDDITKAVPGLKLKRSYDFALPAHMLEIYDFPKSVRTGDLLGAFQTEYTGFSVRWVDDTHAIAIFASNNQSAEALEKGGCGSFRVRSLADSADSARKKAAMVAREQRFDVDLEPAERPKTSAVVARRLIAANVDGKIARQIRAAEEEEKLIKGESAIIDGRKSRSKSESKN